MLKKGKGGRAATMTRLEEPLLLLKLRKTLRHHAGASLRNMRGGVWAMLRSMARKPVFVVGCSRAGTTLVYKTFSESRELGSLGRETHDYWNALHPVAERGWRTHALTAADASGGDRRAVSRFFYEHTGRVRFVDKNNQNGLAIPYLQSLFPDAYFVYITRSPGDNIASLMEGWRRSEAFGAWAAELPFEVAVDGGRFTRWCFFLAEGWRDYRYASLESVCAFQYRAMNESILAARSEIPPAQWIQVRYEDILAAPVETFRRVFEAANVTFDAHLRAHCAEVLGNPYNAFSAVGADKWRASPDAERIEAILPEVEPVARRMGY